MFPPAEQSARGSVTPLLIAGALGQLGSFLLPYTLSAMADALSGHEDWASYLIASELAMLSATTALVSWRLPTLSIRTVSALASLAIAGGQLASMEAHGFLQLLTARICTGLGEGVLLAVAYALIAAGSRAPKDFSMLTFLVTLSAGVALLTVPILIPYIGTRGAFVPQLAGAAIAILGVSRIPRRAQAIPRRADLNWGGNRAFHLLLAILLISLASNTLWEFAAQFSTQVGLPPAHFALVAVVSTFVALGAGPMVYWARLRAGGYLPAVGAIAIQIVAALIYSNAKTRLPFIAAILVLNFMIVFIMPFLRTNLAELDRSGRAAGLSATADNLGTVIGPGAAGLILSVGAGHFGVGLLATLAFLLAWLAASLARRPGQGATP